MISYKANWWDHSVNDTVVYGYPNYFQFRWPANGLIEQMDIKENALEEIYVALWADYGQYYGEK